MSDEDIYWARTTPLEIQEPGSYSEGPSRIHDELQEEVENRMLAWIREIRPYVHGKNKEQREPPEGRVNHKTRTRRFRNRKALFTHLGFDTMGASEKTETLWLVQEPGQGFSVSRWNPRREKAT